MSLLAALSAVYRRDVALAWSGGGGAAAPLGFFIGVVVLMPLAMGPDRALIAASGPPLLWVAAALAALMTLERLFQADLEDASLDQLLLSGAPLELIAATKGAALWTALGLPMAAVGGVLLVTADHGNAEMMRDPETGGPHTAHTTNVVPAILVGAPGVALRDGRLADIAPTLLALMGLPQPAAMTGVSLLAS